MTEKLYIINYNNKSDERLFSLPSRQQNKEANEAAVEFLSPRHHPMTVTPSTLFHLTFIIPVDAGDLDLLSWNILLNEFLSLQPVPECGFPGVPVPSDDNFHWGKEQADK